MSPNPRLLSLGLSGQKRVGIQASGRKGKGPRVGKIMVCWGNPCGLLWQKMRLEGTRPQGQPLKVSESCSTVPRDSLPQVRRAWHTGQVIGLRGEAGTQPGSEKHPVLTGSEKMSRKRQETKERILPEKPPSNPPTGFLATAQQSPLANTGLRTSSYPLEGSSVTKRLPVWISLLEDSEMSRLSPSIKASGTTQLSTLSRISGSRAAGASDLLLGS